MGALPPRPQAPTAGAPEKGKKTLMAEPGEDRAHSPSSPLSWNLFGDYLFIYLGMPMAKAINPNGGSFSTDKKNLQNIQVIGILLVA